MKIETMTKTALVMLVVSLLSIGIGLFNSWIFVVIGLLGLVCFELLSAYIHEWYVEQKEEKY